MVLTQHTVAGTQYVQRDAQVYVMYINVQDVFYAKDFNFIHVHLLNNKDLSRILKYI